MALSFVSPLQFVVPEVDLAHLGPGGLFPFVVGLAPMFVFSSRAAGSLKQGIIFIAFIGPLTWGSEFLLKLLMCEIGCHGASFFELFGPKTARNSSFPLCRSVLGCQD